MIEKSSEEAEVGEKMGDWRGKECFRPWRPEAAIGGDKEWTYQLLYVSSM